MLLGHDVATDAPRAVQNRRGANLNGIAWNFRIIAPMAWAENLVGG